MIPVLQPLPIDWTGKALHNRTKDEIHNLIPQSGLPYRIIVMEKGYFYTDGLYMIDSRGYVLTENDYQCIVPSVELWNAVKLNACAVILITNPDVGNLIKIEAQMVGGRFTSVNPAILETAANVLHTTNRKLYWKDVTDKPDSYRPSGHLHALWELYGFTEQTTTLKRMTTALDKITAKMFDGLLQEFGIEFDQISKNLEAVEARLTTHINDQNNPHKVTASLVGLDQVVNGRVATQADAQTAGNSGHGYYTTPLRTKQMAEFNFNPRFNDHVNNLDNPHQDTAAKLGTLTNLEMRTLALKYRNLNTVADRTARLGGRTFVDYTNWVRKDIPVRLVQSGLLTSSQFTLNPTQSTDYVAQPSTQGYMVWTPFKQLNDAYSLKANKILNAGTFTSPASWGSIDAQAAANWVTSVLGVNYAENTIAVFSVSKSYVFGTGNGAATSTYVMMTMAVLTGGRWMIPGYT